MKNVLDKCRKILGKVGSFFVDGPLAPVTAFVKKYWKYIVAGVAVAVIVLVIVLIVRANRPDGIEEGTETESVTSFQLADEFEVDAYENVNLLISDYLKAYASGEQEVIAALAQPLSDSEKSYIGVYSRFIESYQNIRVYTKPAMEEGSYFAVVYYEVKFYGVNTTAPGLETFYLETAEDGTVYINNLYSNYNRIRMENEMDSNIYYLMNQLEKQEDATALRNQVQEDYNAALASDVDLAVMISTTIPSAVNEWIAQMNALEQAGDGVTDATDDTQVEEPDDSISDSEGTVENPDDGQTPDVEPEPTPDDEQTPDEESAQQPVQVKVTAGSVNVRTEPTVDSNSYGKALEGQLFTKLGESGDWTEVDYEGHSAYIKTEFLETVQP